MSCSLGRECIISIIRITLHGVWDKEEFGHMGIILVLQWRSTRPLQYLPWF